MLEHDLPKHMSTHLLRELIKTETSQLVHTMCPMVSPGGLLVPDGISHQLVSVSSLTSFIRYIYYWNLQFLNNEIIIKK
jgi:hypothetical protein